MEVCWAPMMAAFSVTLDQSDDKAATSLCLLGFRCAVHVTSVMCMQTQRDAFVTSVAKFTYLHNAADMKQKNVNAVKVRVNKNEPDNFICSLNSLMNLSLCQKVKFLLCICMIERHYMLYSLIAMYILWSCKVMWLFAKVA